MDRSRPYLRLDIIITPSANITRLWNTFRPVDRAFLRLIIGDLPLLADSPIDWTLLKIAISFWDTQRAVFSFQGTELVPIIEEYAALLQQSMSIHDIVVPNQFTTIQRESYQRDACHGFLLLIFGTMLFPYSSNLIDGALAQVILQVVGGHSYVEAVLAETIRSLDYVRETRRGRMRGSPHLLQIWLLAHIRLFGLSHPFACITDERSLIACLLHVFRPSDHNYTDWTRFMEELTPTQFLWTTRWNPGDPMIIGCPSVIGLPLISHLGSTLIFPARVIRQLGGLQDIPIEADRTSHRFRWANTTISLPDRVLRVREVRRLWSTRIVQELYFSEHPTDEERAFSATAAYVMQFHPYGFVPRASEQVGSDSCSHSEPRQGDSTFKHYAGPSAGESAQDLSSLGSVAERFCLYRTRVALTRLRVVIVVLTTGVASISYSCTRKNGRRAITRYLGARRATNAGTLSSARHACDVVSRHIYGCISVLFQRTSLLLHRRHPMWSVPTTVHLNPVDPPIYVTDSEDISFSAMTYVPTVSPVSDPMPAPTSVPFPPAAFLSTDSAVLTLPPLTVPTQPPIYTVPPPTVPPVAITQVPASTADHFSFQAPQPPMNFPYPAPPRLNIPPSEPSTPTQAIPAAPSTNIPPEAEMEQERRMKKMEETIKALQAGTSHLDYGDFN
ncbi:hypothetical protein CRG98_003760 [Punica granatum]|uniref:DUF7745 domain-containing protein n=1 Tax=Punica granatum TaxID=22663 RepID=A0A2I0L565_PUNGR|nr:hypothetical protein CRG98_003760 [Punica granatum]